MGTTTPQYVCAFRGRRDSYQVPLALAEGDMLDEFITDAYATRWVQRAADITPKSIREKIAFRQCPGIPAGRVRNLWATTFVEHARHRLGFAPMLTFSKLDQRFSRAAARRAKRNRSQLFLYSPYAWEAFTSRYSHNPRKVLFQYHPHPVLERRILEDDSKHFPGYGESFSGTTFGQVPEELGSRERDVWKHADLIVCASSFTRRSLLEAGADARICRVIPYGIERTESTVTTPPENFRALFVGSGGQRKGLHHLLLAWQRAKLPADSSLTLVCRVIDRQIEDLARGTSRVRIVRGVRQDELSDLYQTSSVFVLPSLVEGFGQVYLEALAHGCPVMGTANTALPDLGGETDGVFVIEPGQVDKLAATLERLSVELGGNIAVRQSARACAARFSWPRFRETIRQALLE